MYIQYTMNVSLLLASPVEYEADPLINFDKL